MQPNPVYVEIKPRITDPDNPRLSASSISSFRKCKKQWYIKYMVGIPTTAGFEAGVGNFIHDIFEDIYNLPKEQRTVEAAGQLAKEGWDEFYGDLFEKFSEAGMIIPDESELKKYTWERTRTLWAIEEPKDVNVLHTELELDLKIDNVHFYGFVDRISENDGEIYIEDYKTGKMGSDSYMYDKINQVLLYGLAYEHLTDTTPAKGKLIFLRDGIVEVDFDSRQFEETQKFLIRNHAAIVKVANGTLDEAPPKTGPLCEWCPFINLCDEGQEMFKQRREEGRSRPDAPAYKILGIDPIIIEEPPEYY